MASIGGIIPPTKPEPTYSPAPSTPSNASDGSSDSSKSTAATDPLANQSTFLTLLVSQLKNQNPLSPMDGTTFVTQLAQFSELEQNLAVRQDMDWISQKFTGLSSLNPEGDTTSGTDGTDTTDSSSAAASGATAPVNTATANGTSGNAAPGKTEDTGSGSNNPSTAPTTAKS